MTAFIRFFDELTLKDVPLVGGKNASLGEMRRELVPKGINVPDGFAVTAEAYRFLLRETGIEAGIKDLLKGRRGRDLSDLAKRGEAIRNLILSAELPEALRNEIAEAYGRLSQKYGGEIDVAVRSSATAEDLPDASFAGQQETFLNVRGVPSLLDACRRCFASLFTNRAISYREDKGFDHLQVALSIGIQKMVRSDLASSGVIFTLDTETGFRDVVLITSSYGLGENIVQGVVNPDEFRVFKPTLKTGHRPILRKQAGTKEIKMIYDTRGGTKLTRNVPVPETERRRFSVTDDEILQLASWAVAIEEHYGRPMDIEWGKDGITGGLFILQARPETVQTLRVASSLETYTLLEKGPVLVSGKAVGSKISSGKARVVRDVKDIASLQEGDILITEMTDPDWEPVMRKCAGLVTERGGRTCHAAIVSRELGLPAVVGAAETMEKIIEGCEVTLSCAEGEEGIVYNGRLKFRRDVVQLDALPKPAVKVMMNVGRPDQAFSLSFLPNDGVGLARMEFIIAHSIGIHPMALIRDKKGSFFVDKLAEGISQIAAAFYPKDVILRMSDFKTNEYANLIGGREFEPEEENPMLGFRGASRYYDDRYRAGFALECSAVRKARDEMGLVNLKVMIPFCRTVEEAKRVSEELAKNGLKRGKDGLEVHMMCEIPSNVLLLEEFAPFFDGFSIGSNDLTQLVLGVDRDSGIVSRLFDERNEAVKKMIRTAIDAAKKAGKKIGLCGQAPSDYPEFARFLLDCGIDSISLNPDAVLRTLPHLAKEDKNESR